MSQVRQFSFTIAASVTFASWQYGSASRLARVPTKLDLMPAGQGYLHDIGWVRTELPYQLWQASLALRHGLAPRPHSTTSPARQLCARRRFHDPLRRLIWKCFSIIAQSRIVDVENFTFPRISW